MLIVGAGPTGLTMAVCLQRLGIPFRIIDKSMSVSNKSKALVIQARTLEVFRQLGLVGEALASSGDVRGFMVHNKGKALAHILFTAIDEHLPPYPFIKILPQDQTERILINDLQQNGVAVEWNTSLQSLAEDEQGVVAQLKQADDSITSVRCDYLVGCDGASSRVRKYMGGEFVGGTYEQAFMLADLDVDWTIDK